MIGHLTGRPLAVQPGVVLLEVGGVGYEVRVPLSAYRLLSGHQEVSLYIHTHVREDQITLYGFPSLVERDTFRSLIGVAGVGPRTAVAVLSGLTPGEIAEAVEGGQWRRLAALPGIGKRTAERLIVELKGSLAAPRAPLAPAREDAVSALVNLGYSPRAAEEVVAAVLREDPTLSLTELLPRALKALVR